MKLLNLEFTRIAHDTFKIKGSKVIYTDPFKVTARDEADIVLLSHEHFDHLSLEDLNKVIFPGHHHCGQPALQGRTEGRQGEADSLSRSGWEVHSRQGRDRSRARLQRQQVSRAWQTPFIQGRKRV